MKKLSINFILLCVALSAFSQDKLDLYGKQIMARYNNVALKSNTINTSTLSEVNDLDRVSLILVLNEGTNIHDIISENDEVEILGQRSNMAIVSAPISIVDKLTRIDAVKRVCFAKKADSKLDEARKTANVDFCHSGTGFENGYNGSGVVVGLFDEGIDPNHVTFMNSNMESTRVKCLWHYEGDGAYVLYDEEDELSKFSTDNAYSTHGTHVAGILTGAYNGNAYYGLAPNADIAIACGDLYETNILLGVENIIEYAKSQIKPAVVNLSLGINIGAHDGSDYFSKYLTELGKEAIICMSAGNEGNVPIVLSKTFTDDDTQIKSFVVENYSSGLYYGNIDVWSDDNTVFSAIPVVYDITADTVVYKMPSIDNCTNGVYVYSGNYAFGNGVQTIENDNFSKAFNGYIGYYSSISPDNGRYEVLWTFDLSNATGNDGRYALAIEVTGTPGQRVDVYSDGYTTEFDKKNKNGWDECNFNGTINSMACGENIIVVGAYNSRSQYERIDGKIYGIQNMTVGDISEFSSYATLVDGRQLPHICAPGSLIVSSVSNHYVANSVYDGIYNSYTEFAAQATLNGRTDYWEVMQGTSMSSPFVAGAVALLLEADPELQFNEVLQIIQETAEQDSYVTNSSNPVQWGAGKINVYKALCQAIESKAGILNVDKSSKGMMIEPIGRKQYRLLIPESSSTATLYNMSGMPVISTQTEDNVLNIDAGNVDCGVYILVVQGEYARYVERLIVK